MEKDDTQTPEPTTLEERTSAMHQRNAEEKAAGELSSLQAGIAAQFPGLYVLFRGSQLLCGDKSFEQALLKRTKHMNAVPGEQVVIMPPDNPERLAMETQGRISRAQQTD